MHGVGSFLGGILADEVFEPLMCSESRLAEFLGHLVGKGPGAGMAVILVLLGIIGFLGCLGFRRSKEIQELEDEYVTKNKERAYETYK